MYEYIYIYIERERERMRETPRSPVRHARCSTLPVRFTLHEYTRSYGNKFSRIWVNKWQESNHNDNDNNSRHYDNNNKISISISSSSSSSSSLVVYWLTQACHEVHGQEAAQGDAHLHLRGGYIHIV